MELLLFVSSQCPHCPSAEETAKKILPEYEKYGVLLRKIRIKTTEGKEMAKTFGVMSLPIIILINNNIEKNRIVGVPDENNLRNAIEKELGLKKSFINKIFGG